MEGIFVFRESALFRNSVSFLEATTTVASAWQSASVIANPYKPAPPETMATLPAQLKI